MSLDKLFTLDIAHRNGQKPGSGDPNCDVRRLKVTGGIGWYAGAVQTDVRQDCYLEGDMGTWMPATVYYECFRSGGGTFAVSKFAEGHTAAAS